MQTPALRSKGENKNPSQSHRKHCIAKWALKQVSGRGIPMLQWLFKIKSASIHCEVRLAQLPALRVCFDQFMACLLSQHQWYQGSLLTPNATGELWDAVLQISHQTLYKRFNAATTFVLGSSPLAVQPKLQWRLTLSKSSPNKFPLSVFQGDSFAKIKLASINYRSFGLVVSTYFRLMPFHITNPRHLMNLWHLMFILYITTPCEIFQISFEEVKWN